MSVSFKINLNTIESGTTATTINIPIIMEYQIVDNSDLIQRVFVDEEVEKAINPILDYEKVRFSPLNPSSIPINKIIFNLNLNGLTNYEDIGFVDSDIRLEKANFKNTFINLAFYDTDNPLTQKLIFNITVFSMITPTDLLPVDSPYGAPGQPKPASMLGLDFIITNPIINPRGFSEGYYLYDYKDELKVGEFKYLYMRSSFKNAKTGISTNLMVTPTASSIDSLVHKLYTRFKLMRNSTGFFYEIDDLYHGDGTSGSNNVVYSSNDVTINLYQILAL